MCVTQEGWVYLSVIKDLYDGFIVASAFDRNNSIAFVINTLRKAKQKEKVTDGLVLHSDQGHQYTSQAYHNDLTHECNITPPCRGAEIAGTMPVWTISSVILKKSAYAISKTYL